jgi:MoaA/NifB/PqqE/SkfB family radical SAM enzyme
METTIVLNRKYKNEDIGLNYQPKPITTHHNSLNTVEKWFVLILIKLRIFFIACITLKSAKKIKNAFISLLKLRDSTWGGNLKKMYKVDGKYYFNLYTPGWPSAAYDDVIKSELQRYDANVNVSNKLKFIFFAITRKCPMACEHCFECDNLNQKETFTKNELIKIVDFYQNQGINQIQFSGGEPLVRIHDLIDVINYAQKRSECYIVTSGFNLSPVNAMLLKNAGCKGIIVSIDHYVPELHDKFRHHPDIFNKAVAGVKASINAGIVTALSVCTTMEFLDGDHLYPYFEFAKNLGVQFVQILEPKAIGNYSNKGELLKEMHLKQLEEFFTTVNHTAFYKNYPTVMYHGYHQRRVGCFSGSRSLYIDSAGDVNACPFCHTKSYNVKAILEDKGNMLPVKENLCPRYEQIA